MMKDALRGELDRYSNGLQRYFSLLGLSQLYFFWRGAFPAMSFLTAPCWPDYEERLENGDCEE